MIRTSAARFALIAYAALTVVFTLPLGLHLGDRLPHDAGDPLFLTWGLWWNARTVPLTTAWWNPPAFFPMTGALALSDHLLGLVPMTSSVQWLGGSPVLAYNVAFLLSFLLAGFCTFLLCRELTGRADVAFVAGLLFAFNPYRWSMVSHLQLLVAFWMPLALFASHRFLATGATRWALLFAGAWLLQGLSNGYMLVFFSLVVIAWVLWFVPWRREPRRGLVLLGSVVVAAGLLAPILAGYSTIQTREGLSRSIDEIDFYGADVAGLITPSSITTVYPNWHPWPTSEENLFPGVVLLGLSAVLVWWTIRQPVERDRWRPATVGLSVIGLTFVAIAVSVWILGPWSVRAGPLRVGAAQTHKPLMIAFIAWCLAALTSRRMRDAWHHRSPLVFYALGALACYILSWGLRPRLFGAPWLYFGPYSLLMHFPGLRELRVPARVWLPGVLLLTVAAALALARILPDDRRKRRAAIAALIVAALVDGASIPLPLASLPALSPLDRVPMQAAVLELPLGELSRDISAMYRGTWHDRPVVNGYSGYMPRHYEVLRHALADGDFDVVLELARHRPVTLAVAKDYASEDLLAWITTHPDVRPLEHASHGTRMFVVPLQPTPPPVDARAIRPVNVTASVMVDAARRIADGDLTTRWDTHRAQHAGDTVILDAGRAIAVRGVALALGEFATDYPRNLEVSLSTDGTTWTQAWGGRIAALALRGALVRPTESQIRIAFAPQIARFVRLRTLTDHSIYYWSIAEAWLLE